jgi:hypothetical protein
MYVQKTNLSKLFPRWISESAGKFWLIHFFQDGASKNVAPAMMDKVCLYSRHHCEIGRIKLKAKLLLAAVDGVLVKFGSFLPSSLSCS